MFYGCIVCTVPRNVTISRMKFDIIVVHVCTHQMIRGWNMRWKIFEFRIWISILAVICLFFSFLKYTLFVAKGIYLVRFCLTSRHIHFHYHTVGYCVRYLRNCRPACVITLPLAHDVMPTQSGRFHHREWRWWWWWWYYTCLISLFFDFIHNS